MGKTARATRARWIFIRKGTGEREIRGVDEEEKKDGRVFVVCNQSLEIQMTTAMLVILVEVTISANNEVYFLTPFDMAEMKPSYSRVRDNK